MSELYTHEQMMAAHALVKKMTDAQKKALLRFNETTEDDQSYDISTTMRTELRQLGLIRHAGGSRFTATDTFGPVVERLRELAVPF